MILSTQASQKTIHSIIFTKDNLGAFISVWGVDIKRITWRSCPKHEADFKIAQMYKKLVSNKACELCLTRNDESLLMSASKSLKIFCLTTISIIKKISMGNSIYSINLINSGKSALITEQNGR